MMIAMPDGFVSVVFCSVQSSISDNARGPIKFTKNQIVANRYRMEIIECIHFNVDIIMRWRSFNFDKTKIIISAENIVMNAR